MCALEKVVVLLIFLISAANSARILGIVHMPTYSHFHLGDQLFRKLAAEGHEVTIISPFELKAPTKNLKHIVITGFLEKTTASKTDFVHSTSSIISKVIFLDLIGIDFVEMVLKHPNVQELLNSKQNFDLVVYENFINEAFTGFAYHYKVPYVLLNTFGATRWSNLKMGNPSNPAYTPDPFLSNSGIMSFPERFYNTLIYLGGELFSHFYTKPKQNELLQKYFPGAPHLNELMYNASIMLLNSHPSIGAPLPLVPNMIEIGGYHIKPPNQLPKDIQDYLDDAKDGAIFFSMGSLMKSKDMPEEKRNAIIGSLRKLKQRVLWKWEDDVLAGQPSNIKLGKWLPQQDILAHPNIKLFITHGGILSTTEAIYHGVPVLGIPVFGDQELNIRNAQNAGYGITVPYSELTEPMLSAALNEVLSNKVYTTNAKQRSNILHDQQTKPLDRAVYWIEYVIRHQGANHLKTAALSLQWYECLLLDILAAVVASIAISLWIVCKIVKLLCRKNNKIVLAKDKKGN